MDQKSNGFRWESSKLRDRQALQRLCFVMAAATWVLICQGSAVVAEGHRRVVDPHGFRGHRYARIGWDGIRHALARGKALMPRLTLATADDPERARAAKRQPDRSRWGGRATLEVWPAAARPGNGHRNGVKFCQSIRPGSMTRPWSYARATRTI